MRRMIKVGTQQNSLKGLNQQEGCVADSRHE